MKNLGYGDVLADLAKERLRGTKRDPSQRRLMFIAPATYAALRKFARALSVQVGFHVWPMQVAALILESEGPPENFATKCEHSTRRAFTQGMCVDCFYEKVKSTIPDTATRHRLRALKMSIEAYDKMLRAQKKLCAICSKPSPTKSRLSIDHDHKTGFVRGLLCVPCNTALGMYEANPTFRLRAEAYLVRAKMREIAEKGLK